MLQKRNRSTDIRTKLISYSLPYQSFSPMMPYTSLTSDPKSVLSREIRKLKSVQFSIACRDHALQCEQKVRTSGTYGKPTIAGVIKSFSIPNASSFYHTIGKFWRYNSVSLKPRVALFTWICDQGNLKRLLNGPTI